MALKDFFNLDGWWWKGNKIKVDKEIEFDEKANPEIDTNTGATNGFVWKIKNAVIQSWKIRNEDTGEDVFVVNTSTKTVNIIPPYKAEGFTDKVEYSVSTTTAVAILAQKIDSLVDDSMHLIEIKGVAKDTLEAEYGLWCIILSVTKFGGTPIIRVEDVISHDSSAGLNANSVSFAVNAGDIDVFVTGIAATTIQWNLEHTITKTATN
jgi:hypothetical protein